MNNTKYSINKKVTKKILHFVYYFLMKVRKFKLDHPSQAFKSGNFTKSKSKSGFFQMEGVVN